MLIKVLWHANQGTMSCKSRYYVIQIKCYSHHGTARQAIFVHTIKPLSKQPHVLHPSDDGNESPAK